MIRRLRLQLAQNDTLVLLSILGVLAGLLTSGTILLFRLAIEVPLDSALPGQHHEYFESLNPWWRFFLPLSGSILLAIIFYQLSLRSRIVGISHVLERIKHHQGHMPFAPQLVERHLLAAVVQCQTRIRNWALAPCVSR